MKQLALLFLLAVALALPAQTPLPWSLLPGIEGGACHSAAYDPETGTLFLVMVDGLYRSLNEGEQWDKVLDLGQGTIPYRHQYQVDAWGGRVAVLRYEVGLAAPQLFYSENLGTDWNSVSLPPGTGSTAPIGNKIALFEDFILLNFGEGQGVYYSTDGGQHWTEPAFFQSALFSLATPPIPSLIRSKNRLYLYSFFNIYYTDGNPEQWDTLPLPPGVSIPELKFAHESRVLIADGATGQYYATYNTGANWASVSLHPAVQAAGFWYGQKADTLLTGSEAIYRSVFPFTNALPENGLIAPYFEYIPFWTDHFLLGIRTLETNDLGLYTVPGRGLYRVRVDGQLPTYSNSNRGLPDGTVQHFFSSPKGMVALGPTGLFRYSELQQQWDTLWQSTEMPSAVQSVVAIEDTFWIIAHSGQLYKAIGEGAAFQPDLSYTTQVPADIPLNRLEWRDGALYLFNYYKSLYSLDSARTWNAINDPWPFELYRNIVGANGHFLVVYRNAFGVLECYMTHDWGVTWTFLSNVKPDSEDRIYYNDGRFFAFDEQYNNQQPFLWRSLNNGLDWTKVTAALPPAPTIGTNVHPLVFSSGATLFFGQAKGRLYVSKNFGNTWEDANDPGNEVPVIGMRCMGEHEGYLYLGTGSLGVWRTAAPVRTNEPEAALLPLSVYPNPAAEVIYWSGNEQETGVYAIHDALGRRIRYGAITAGQPLSLKSLPPGVYWLFWQHQAVGRFIKD